MAECCIIGCPNKVSKRGQLKFYTLPTAKSSRPNKVKRRQLWLEALEKANGSTAGLKDDAQICSAHFVSGQMSLVDSDQDFVPSVFPKPPEKTRRDTLRSRSGVVAEAPKVTPTKTAERKRAKAPEEVPHFKDVVSPKNNYCEPLEDEEFMEENVKEVTHSSSNDATTQPPVEVTTEPSIKVPPEYPPLKKLKLELKSVITRSRLFQCEVCNGKFSSGSSLVSHKRLHDQEWSENESWPTVSEKASEKSDCPVLVEEALFKCNMCDRSFPTTHNLKRHKLLHIRDSRKCKQCGTMFCKRHNHVMAQPQISTETNFEDYRAEDGKIKAFTKNQKPVTSSCNNDDVEEGLDFLLNSDSKALDNIAAAAQENPSENAKERPAPHITISPRKPSLLISFKSFLSKCKIPNVKSDQPQPSSSSTSNDSTENVESMEVTTPDATVAPATSTVTSLTASATSAATSLTASATSAATSLTATASATSAVTSLTASATSAVTSLTASGTSAATSLTATASATAATITADTPQPMPDSSNPLPLKSTTSLSSKVRKPVLIVSQPPQPSQGQPAKNIKQVCLSFSKPVPCNVLKDFMTFITNNECSKSSGPRVITFTTKPNDIVPSQLQPATEISSIVRLEPGAVRVHAPQLTSELTANSDKQKKTFIITTQHTPSPQTVAPQKAPSQKPSAQKASPVEPKKKPNQTPQPKPKSKKKIKTLEEIVLPWKPYIHGSCPHPPVPILAKIQSGPWDSPFPNYSKDFIQPHLPQTPVLPPSLQMFSPQFLTSAFLDVKRDYDYILSK